MKAADFIKPAQNINTTINVEYVIYSSTDICCKYCQEWWYGCIRHLIQLLGSSLSDHTNCSWNELWVHILKNPYVKPHTSNTNCVTLTPTDTAADYGRCNGIIEVSCYIIQTSLKKQKNCARCSTHTAYTNLIHTI